MARNFKNPWGKGTYEGEKWSKENNVWNDNMKNELFENDNDVLNSEFNAQNTEIVQKVGSLIYGYKSLVCSLRPWKNAIEFLANVVKDDKSQRKYRFADNTSSYSRFVKTFCDVLSEMENFVYNKYIRIEFKMFDPKTHNLDSSTFGYVTLILTTNVGDIDFRNNKEAITSENLRKAVKLTIQINLKEIPEKVVRDHEEINGTEMAMNVLIHEVCLHAYPMYKSIIKFNPNNEDSVNRVFSDIASLNSKIQHEYGFRDNYDIEIKKLPHIPKDLKDVDLNVLGAVTFRKALNEMMNDARERNADINSGGTSHKPIFFLDTEELRTKFKKNNKKIPNNSMYNLLIANYISSKLAFLAKDKGEKVLGPEFYYFENIPVDFQYYMVPYSDLEKS